MFALLFLSFSAAVWGQEASDSGRAERVERRVGLMGTLLSIEVEAPTREAALLASEAAVRALEAVEARLSTWRDDSELARLNRTPAGEAFPLSPALRADLAIVGAWWRATGGAFDPGVGALVEAWGLRTGGRRPGADELRAARAGSGFQLLELGEHTAVRRHERLAIEEGGFGKGIGLDAAIAALRDAGATRATLDLGGQVVFLADGDAVVWAVAHPRDRSLPAVEVEIDRGSLATSGNSERGILVAGEPRSHILDPRTGSPAPDFGSLTVWAPDATTADCLSTGLYVLGPMAALAFAEDHDGIEVLVLETTAGELVARATSGLRDRIHPAIPGLEIRFEGSRPEEGPAVEAEICDEKERAQEGDDRDLAKRVAELERKLEIMGEEVESFRLGDLVPSVGESYSGLGPAASKIYAKDQGLSIGGYGEALFSAKSGDGDELDFQRLVLYFGYKFDERWVLNSEIEFEHASTDKSGSETVEFAYLDYLASEQVNGRAGLLLLPMGFVNELHEPTSFLGASRPETERRILPTTWRENGLGAHGDVGGFAYRSYLVNGLDSEGFSPAGIRDGRQKGSKAKADDFAWVTRVDWVDTPGVIVGGSFYYGDSDQDRASFGKNTTTIYELHGEYRARGLWLRGLVARAEIDDVDDLNAALIASGDLAAGETIGEELEGTYFEAGYDVMALIDPESEASISPYVRWESIDTQAEVPSGFSADPDQDDDIITFGVNLMPIDQLVFKIEYQDWDGDGPDRFQVLMGYVF
ncbi:MAG: FAD:protein FMN transferase [Planctomycetota bacterium]|nr:FAD:protein FMN transferase [Planctomycetota bacterium]